MAAPRRYRSRPRPGGNHRSAAQRHHHHQPHRRRGAGEIRGARRSDRRRNHHRAHRRCRSSLAARLRGRNRLGPREARRQGKAHDGFLSGQNLSRRGFVHRFGSRVHAQADPDQRGAREAGLSHQSGCRQRQPRTQEQHAGGRGDSPCEWGQRHHPGRKSDPGFRRRQVLRRVGRANHRRRSPESGDRRGRDFRAGGSRWRGQNHHHAHVLRPDGPHRRPRRGGGSRRFKRSGSRQRIRSATWPSASASTPT